MVKLYAIRYLRNACAAILDEKEKAERLAAFLREIFPQIPFDICEVPCFFPSWEAYGEEKVIKATQAFFHAEKSGLMLHLAIAQAFPDMVKKRAMTYDPDTWARLARESKLTITKGLRAIYAAQARAYWLCVNGHWHKKGL